MYQSFLIREYNLYPRYINYGASPLTELAPLPEGSRQEMTIYQLEEHSPGMPFNLPLRPFGVERVGVRWGTLRLRRFLSSTWPHPSLEEHG